MMKENGRGSANLHPVTVKTFAEATGISERQAKYWRKGWANPVTRVMLAGGHVKPYQAARLVDEWDLGSLARTPSLPCSRYAAWNGYSIQTLMSPS